MRYADLEKYPNEWLNTITHEDIENNTFPVIIDRDKSDVDIITALSKKRWEDFTDAEKRYWWGIVKGAYNDEDMNRVGFSVEYLSGLLSDAGYQATVNSKTDWGLEDIPTPEQLEIYLQNVRVLRALITVSSDTPQVPSDMENLTWQDANDIERILMDIESLLIKSMAAFRHCGAAVCGGGGLLIL